MACPLASERIWTDKHQYNAAERKYYESLSKGAGNAGGCTLVSEIAKARQHIKDSLERMDGIAALASTPGAELLDRLATVEKENSSLRETVKKLENLVISLTSRVSNLEGGKGPVSAPTKAAPKPALIAKSSIILEVKPWDDETDMKELEQGVRKIEMDGLIWGAAKLVPVGYGINKLQICCVIEDDKVSVDELQEKIQEDEDHVQSVDIAAFNKI
uniref:CSON013436 protein n=1 Tax=Culicoides sonorensis TaxID=179676 RepID=A0A336KPK6_CULSO